MKTKISIVLLICLKSFIIAAQGTANFYPNLYTQNIPSWLNQVNVFSGNVPQDVLQMTNATVIAWGISALAEDEKVNLQNSIDNLHQSGLKYVSGLSPITTTGKVFNAQPELLDAVCLDIDNQRIQLDWYPIGPEEPFYWGCTNQPAWQNYLKGVIERNIDCGADGIQIDEIYGTQHVIWRAKGCFCAFCMSGFRDFLKNRFTQEELKNQYGIADVDSFHYQQYIIDNNHTNTWKGNDMWLVPLFNEYHLYQKEVVQSVMKNLIAETRQYALDNYGREISYSANINDLNPSGLKFTDDLDIFILEYFYKENGYPPQGKATSVLKLAHSLDNKTGILMTAINTNADLMKYAKTANLMKIYIAEAYSGLGSFFVPYMISAFDESTGTSPGAYTADIQAISPYYQFIVNHPAFYENLSSIAKTGLLYIFSSDDNSGLNSFHGAGYALSDLNIQYDVIFAGDNHFLSRPLQLDTLNKYEVVILPQNQNILQTDWYTILGYLKSGGKITGWGDIDIIDDNGNRVIDTDLESFKSEGHHTYGQGIFYYFKKDLGEKYLLNDRSYGAVSGFSDVLDSLLTQRMIRTSYSNTRNFFTYINPNNSDLFIHMINYNHDINTDSYVREDSITLTFNLPDSCKYSRAFLASPDFPDLISLSLDSSDRSLSIIIPSLDIYNIVYLTQREPSKQFSIISTSPAVDTTITAGQTLVFHVEVENNEEFPLFYRWFVNGEMDSSAQGKSYSLMRDRDYTGTDTVQVFISDGFQELTHTWAVQMNAYIYPKILFDEAHNEYNTISQERANLLNPEHPGWVYFGILKSQIETDFIIERFETGALTSSVLQDYHVLILSAPQTPFSNSEINDIVAFVSNGGGLCFLGDAGLNIDINPLLQNFGIQFDSFSILEPVGQNQGDGNCKIKNFSDHPSIGSVDRFDMNWGGSFTVTSPAEAVGFTESNTFQDKNWNQIKDGNDPEGSFSVMCATEYNKGRVFCVSDNSFHDDYIQWEQSQNDELFLNVLQWLTENVNQEVTSVTEITGFQRSFCLNQNYPNPFNPVTNIEFQLPKSGRIVIKVFNMLGQEIKTLIDKHVESGWHKVSWDGKDYSGSLCSNGIYLYRMEAGDFVDVKKGVLLK
jgi:hypothetical protein